VNASIWIRERSLELSDLALFKTVAEAGGVTRAAHRLHRVQSNVTARVKRLEAHLGVPLFVRARRGMSLTPEGRRLLDYADRLLALAEEAQADVGDRSPRGRLLIGAMESTAAVHLPRLLSTLHARYPALEVQLVTATSGVLVAQVRSPFTQRPTLFIYENQPGGVGMARRLFQIHSRLVHAARDLLQHCSCPSGCPGCVGPSMGETETNKRAAVTLLARLSNDSPANVPA